MGTLLPTTAKKEMERTTFQKVGSALFYALCSNTLVFVNKSVLTNDKFPSRTLLGCGQMVSGTLPASGFFHFLPESDGSPDLVFYCHLDIQRNIRNDIECAIINDHNFRIMI